MVRLKTGGNVIIDELPLGTLNFFGVQMGVIREGKGAETTRPSDPLQCLEEIHPPVLRTSLQCLEGKGGHAQIILFTKVQNSPLINLFNQLYRVKGILNGRNLGRFSF